MIPPQRARKIVLSSLASFAASLGKWQTRVDAARHLMYRRDEPLTSVACYFEDHSTKDWSPVRRFTGHCVASCLQSRLVRTQFSPL